MDASRIQHTTKYYFHNENAKKKKKRKTKINWYMCVKGCIKDDEGCIGCVQLRHRRKAAVAFSATASSRP